MNTVTPTLILNAEQIRQKIRRIAFQMYETNFEESALLLAGISGEGYVLAQALAQELQQIAPFQVELIKLELDKNQLTQPPVRTSHPDVDYTDKVVIIVDDVLYTGRTLAFSLQPFLCVSVRKLQVAVLIDRNYPRFPVSADYKGYELSTTLTDHVEVILSDENQMGVYLR
ncbi:phosphoribosyltransferase family protein [Spirosoma utsteinense]|uniref:Pyrimidine operon attenuation protein/uracil phosphoribosyltransferase n=1 Tax=Spirosoma utsteinense TaxID=2585773 RepID=A0ABR6WB87_9BACT|nr:phosphoribosyltransferase family protein [Spirosoma utsteinense]MBC3788505.1 pyrimidine operon attenuation protein/uracil phosphoribosyltransferase [Spirosoma utsteinense]MBC3793181.1 pyrimidine operon attenuation protein/uracil phosphoribosyltransferase [Spirosoma utsteinense]